MRRVSRRFGSHCPVQAPGLAALVVLVCVDLPAVSPFRVHGLGAGLPWARRAPKASGATALQCREPKGYAVVTAEGDGKAANLVIGNREGRRKWARTSGLTTTAAAILGTTQAANGKASDREDLELPVLLTYDQKLRNLLCDLKDQHARIKDEIVKEERRYAPDEVVHRLKKQKLAIKDRTHVRPQSPSPRPQRPNAPPGQGAWEQLAVSLVGRGAQLIERALTAVARPPKVLGEGAMGCVVLGRDMREGGQVAIKVAASAAGGGDALRREYQMLRRLRGVVGVPEAKYFGRQAIAGQESFVLVMDLFGPSLEDLWWQTTGGGAGFEAGSALRLAGEMLTLLESVHRAGVVHRDVKPDNFLVGRGGKGLRLIDFGIALPRDVASDPSGFEGTLRFAPRAAHALRRQGPADDLESLVYTLAFMLRGALPWDAGAADAVAEGKRAAVAALAEGGGAGGAGALVRGLDPACAAAVAGLLAHVASLGTDDEPDYAHCRALVAAAAEVQPLISGSQLAGGKGSKGGAAARSAPLIDWEAAGLSWTREGTIQFLS